MLFQHISLYFWKGRIYTDAELYVLCTSQCTDGCRQKNTIHINLQFNHKTILKKEKL